MGIPPIRVVIDSDPGIDDIVTLALAARSPELEVVAVTTTYGNASLQATTRNAVELLRLAGRTDIRVKPGCQQPLERLLAISADSHGPEGVGYAQVPSPLPAMIGSEVALLEVLRDQPWAVTLVTLGPLTNLAHALLSDPKLVCEKVDRHVGSFGTFVERGGPDSQADFNAWSDPEAADHVLRADLDTYMVGLDVTRQMRLTATEVARLQSSEDLVVQWIADALAFSVDVHRRRYGFDGCTVNDVLTVGELLDPGVLTPRVMRVRMDTGDAEARGRVLEDQDGSLTTVASAVDIARLRQQLGRLFGDGWAR